MVELAVVLFLEYPMAGQETQDAMERRFVCSRCAGERCHRSRRAGLDLVGKAEFGDGANGATERGAQNDAG